MTSMEHENNALSSVNNSFSQSDLAYGVNVKDFGAVGDGVTNDTEAFRAAMAVCGMKRTLLIPAGTYLIMDTIVNNAGRIVGEGKHVDSGKGGTLLSFGAARTAANDMKPCLLFDKGSNIVVEHLSVRGRFNYEVRELANYIDKALFDQRKIEMFVPGLVGVKIDTNSQVTFNQVSTGSLKCGVQSNNRTGHINWLECDISGLFGIYISRATGDYYYHGGTLRGTFAGCLLGDTGANWEMTRVHMGFNPYCFFQVNDGQIDSGAETNRKGMEAWQFKSVKFERVGECIADLLPDSLSWETSIEAYGFTWSDLNPSSGWYSAMPDALIPPSDKQKYAVRMGRASHVRFLTDYTTAQPIRPPAFRSEAVGGKAIYIDNLLDDCIFDNIPSTLIEVRTKAHGALLSAGLPDLYKDAISQFRQPIVSGQLLNTNPSSWELKDCTVEAVSAAELPADLALTYDAMCIYGPNPTVYKLTPTPGTTRLPEVNFPALDHPNSIYSGFLFYRSFANIASGLGNNRISFDLEGQDLTSGAGVGLVPRVVHHFPSKQWRGWSGNQVKRANTRIRKAKITSYNLEQPVYFMVPMLSEHAPLPFSPTKESYSRNDLVFAPGKNLILTSPNGTKYRLGVSDTGTFTATQV